MPRHSAGRQSLFVLLWARSSSLLSPSTVHKGSHTMQKPTKAETVTLRHLAAALAESHGVPKNQTNAILTDMVETIAGHLKRGRRIRFSGLGMKPASNNALD